MSSCSWQCAQPQHPRRLREKAQHQRRPACVARVRGRPSLALDETGTGGAPLGAGGPGAGEPEGRALIRFPFRTDPRPEPLRSLPGRREAQADPFELAGGMLRLKQPEQPVLVPRVEAHPVVFHPDQALGPGFLHAEVNAGFVAGLGELQGV